MMEQALWKKFIIGSQIFVMTICACLAFIVPTSTETKAWALALLSYGSIEIFYSQGRSIAFLFSSFGLLSAALAGVEGLFFLIMATSFVVLQKLQRSKPNKDPRTQAVLVFCLLGIAFLAGSISSDNILRSIFYVFFSSLMVVDWPIKELLAEPAGQDKELSNYLQILRFAPAALLLAIAYRPGNIWIGHVFIVLGLITFLGREKQRAFFLLLLGSIWCRPDMSLLLPTGVLLFLGGTASATVASLLALIILSFVDLPIEPDFKLPLAIGAGIFIGWFRAESSLPDFKEKDVRDYLILAVAILTIILVATLENHFSDLFVPTDMTFALLASVLAIELIKRLVAPLHAIKFQKSFNRSMAELLGFIPALRTIESEPLLWEGDYTQFLLSGRELPTVKYQNFLVGGALFAILLWSVVIWCFYGI